MGNKLTAKAGSHYHVERHGDAASLHVRAESLQLVGRRFSASWIRLDWHPGTSVVFCFAQAIDGMIASRVDVRFTEEAFQAFVDATVDFIRTAAEGDIADPASWTVVDARPAPNRYLLEDATLITAAYTGNQAELTFHWVPAVDMSNAIRGIKEPGFAGPETVLTVCLTTKQLRWLLREVTNLIVKMKEEAEGGTR